MAIIETVRLIASRNIEMMIPVLATPFGYPAARDWPRAIRLMINPTNGMMMANTSPTMLRVRAGSGRAAELACDVLKIVFFFLLSDNRRLSS